MLLVSLLSVAVINPGLLLFKFKTFVLNTYISFLTFNWTFFSSLAIYRAVQLASVVHIVMVQAIAFVVLYHYNVYYWCYPCMNIVDVFGSLASSIKQIYLLLDLCTAYCFFMLDQWKCTSKSHKSCLFCPQKSHWNWYMTNYIVSYSYIVSCNRSVLSL